MNEFICNQTLLQHIKGNLDKFDQHTHSKEGYKKAAVAITVVNIGNTPVGHGISNGQHSKRNAAIVLTRRGSGLKNHAGQWALPGGRMETGENPGQTALRELSEEVGLNLDVDSIIGYLDDFTTRSGFIIKPVVVWGGTGVELIPNPGEVASVHRIPLAEFMRGDAPLLQKIPESEHPVLLMPIGQTWIAAPTAALLYQFREVAILGNTKRVAHYEQPYFAWQ